MLNEHCKNEQQKRARLDRRNAKDRAKRSSEKGIEKEENDKQSLRMPSTEEMKEKGWTKKIQSVLNKEKLG